MYFDLASLAPCCSSWDRLGYDSVLWYPLHGPHEIIDASEYHGCESVMKEAVSACSTRNPEFVPKPYPLSAYELFEVVVAIF
jgi:hypothetical protein